jgi:hypothetical protein
MENKLIIGLILVVLLFIAAFVYECGRRIYYWSAAKLFGWTETEKFDRETAWLDRAVEKDRRLAKRDSSTAVNTERRRIGVSITTIAVAWLAYELNVPVWETVLIAAGVYVGLTMSAGLAWKWW